MKRGSIASLVVVVLGTGIYLYLSNNSEKEKVVNSPRSVAVSTETPINDGSNTPKGQYLDYTPNVISATAGTKILFFYAPWCSKCRALEADIKSKGVPSGVSIIKVDYDKNQSLRQKYGVTIQTTLVKIDDQGNLLEKYVSYEDPSLEAVKRNLL